MLEKFDKETEKLIKKCGEGFEAELEYLARLDARDKLIEQMNSGEII